MFSSRWPPARLLLRSAAVALHALPFSDRPRERLVRLGDEALADAELLAVVLGTGTAGASALDAATAILETFGELRRVAHAGLAELAAIKGMGMVRACQVKAALGLAGRLAERPLARGEPIGTPRSIYQRFGPTLNQCETERFVAVPLDRRNRVLRVLTVAQGGVCSVEIIPRDVFAAIVREAPCSVVFLHNHPSGDPRPSSEDWTLTDRLRLAGRVLGIPMQDHVIIGQDGYFSFFENDKEFATRIDRS